MTTTIVITCPKCKKQMKAPADLEGKRIKCKPCGTVFVVSSSQPKSVPAGKTAVAQKTAPARKPAPKAAEPEPEPEVAAAAEPEGDEDEGGIYGVQETGDGPVTTSPKAAEDDEEEEKPAPAPRPKTADDEDDNPNPYDITDLDLAPRCPHCANEMESPEAVVCLKCGYNTATRELGKTTRAFAHTPFEMMMWSLPGVILFIVFLACLVGIGFLWFGLPRMAERDPESTVAWLGNNLFVKAYGTVFFAFAGWKCLRFAIFRLIKHPKPPEKIKK